MTGLITPGSAKSFFRALLDEAMGHQGLEVAEGTELYLVNLLSDFMATDRLFDEEDEGRKDHEPLAVLYHRALQEDREGRIRLLRRLGDLSLYKVGFFASALRERVVGPDYYIQMGGAAYGQVADLSRSSGFSGVYRELCLKFRALVEVLEEIAARSLVSSGPAGALEVYESWERSGNGRLEQVLVEAGLLPGKKGLPN